MTGASEIRIVHATPDDVPLVHDMIEALADHLQLAHEVVATEDDLRHALFGPNPRAEVAIAYVGDDPAGFALFYDNYSTFRGRCGLHLEDLFVRRGWRGYGIGRRLLAYLAALTLARGCGRLEWWVLTDDEAAVAFYEKLGASAKGEWTIYHLMGDALATLAAENP
jgi:GNAT superfamily N-acetyltransferase